jgi:hypothetical protein
MKDQTFDYLAEARGIRDSLGDDLAESKARIYYSIASGSTALEILSEVCSNLEELLETKPDVPTVLLERIRSYIRHSRDLLGMPPAEGLEPRA